MRRDTPTRETLVTATVSMYIPTRTVRVRACIVRRAYSRRTRSDAECAASGAERSRRARGVPCLVKATTSCVLPSPWVVVWSGVGAQARRPSAAECGRVLPRSTYERVPRDGYMVVGPRPRDRTAVQRTRPELNLKFTDNDTAREQMCTVAVYTSPLYCLLKSICNIREKLAKRLNS